MLHKLAKNNFTENFLKQLMLVSSEITSLRRSTFLHSEYLYDSLITPCFPGLNFSFRKYTSIFPFYNSSKIMAVKTIVSLKNTVVLIGYLQIDYLLSYIDFVFKLVKFKGYIKKFIFVEQDSGI